MNGVLRVLRDEPTVIVAAVRQVLLAVVLLGMSLSDEQVVAIMLAVEALLTFANRAAVTPVVKAEARAEAIVERAMSPDLTPEEWASLNELRAERDALRNQRG